MTTTPLTIERHGAVAVLTLNITSPSAVLPSTSLAMPVRPWLPMTIASTARRHDR